LSRGEQIKAPRGTFDVLAPGVHMELGQLDGGHSDALDNTVAELDVDNVAVTLRSDVISAMWEKFALITATAALTCLVGEPIGPIAQADGGIDLARAILAEVASVAEAEGHPLAANVRAGLDAILTDPSSTSGPSMFRDLQANRPVDPPCQHRQTRLASIVRAARCAAGARSPSSRPRARRW